MKNKPKKVIIADKRTTLNLWEQYNNFIRSLHLRGEFKEPTTKQKILDYLKKVLVVFISASFTTLTFYFLIDPNNLYNSGLNGLLQVFSRLIIGRFDIGWQNYYLLYYSLGLLTNLCLIFFLRTFFKAKLGIISTSIFYVFSQIIWTKLFDWFNLREYLFNRFNPAGWQGLSGRTQLSFTLPYYIIIAVVAAIIHTYGYSLILRAQATPGGLDIITSHFSTQKKPKFSLNKFNQVFGFVIIFVVAIINFFYIDNNYKMKKSLLERDLTKLQVRYGKKDQLDDIINQWKENMEKAQKLTEKGDLVGSFALRKEEKNNYLTLFFKNKIGEPDIESYPQEIDYYLATDEEKINLLQKEVNHINSQLVDNSLTPEKLKKKLSRKYSLIERKDQLKKDLSRNKLIKIISELSNNERLWATLVYILLSSYLLKQIFPRDQIVSLNIHTVATEDRDKGLKLLDHFSPIYYTVYRRKIQQEEIVYVINCRLSKWNYYLYLPYLKQIGKIYEVY